MIVATSRVADSFAAPFGVVSVAELAGGSVCWEIAGIWSSTEISKAFRKVLAVRTTELLPNTPPSCAFFLVRLIEASFEILFGSEVLSYRSLHQHEDTRWRA